MPNILHRISIDAPPDRVQQLTATADGIQQWWGTVAIGDDTVGGRIAVHFSDRERPAVVFEVLERAPERIVWRCVEGPADWIDTRVTFAFTSRHDGGTTLLFSHRGWREESEFMSGCSSNWAAYLMSLKSGAEGQGFSPWPGGEVSRWD
jgi:uncharacterized protein YndB with AHSA1/START domain